VFIENQAGTNIKKTYNEKTLEYLYEETVSSNYPFAYGFILETTSGDGDNVDCFVITDQKLESGSIVYCEAIGIIPQVEDGEVDNTILATLRGETIVVNEEDVKRIQNFAQHVFDHIPGKEIQVGELMPKNTAERFIESCLD